MLFTVTPPAQQRDVIALYFDLEKAQTSSGPGERVHCVAVHYDGLNRRLLSLEQRFATWTAPADHTEDGLILTKALIPSELYVY